MRIGLLGGSFDPIHNAHLKLAKAAVKQLRLNKLYLVVSPRSPFKLKYKQTDPRLRLQMVKLALKQSANIHVADWEVKRKGLSYTIQTLRSYKKKNPQHELFLILGSDVWNSFHRWNKAREIRRMCTLVVGRRPGFAVRSLSAGAVLLKGIFPDISSTQMRSNIAGGRMAKRRLPLSVWKFIQKRKLYGYDERI